ncbi:hypothetical protein B0J13DRAFT_610165 [Dactylonectria estremocensis]|uniref:Uncharacterized protein n=1 Tax=Dactylonectria estremocensis TaxID=1079267 RepID=A0A9P9IXR7_9HYPO|nr:hypothetical protein B0J13DRAFT_610165 [Dactylonectria estremocensis]
MSFNDTQPSTGCPPSSSSHTPPNASPNRHRRVSIALSPSLHQASPGEKGDGDGEKNVPQSSNAPAGRTNTNQASSGSIPGRENFCNDLPVKLFLSSWGRGRMRLRMLPHSCSRRRTVSPHRDGPRPTGVPQSSRRTAKATRNKLILLWRVSVSTPISVSIFISMAPMFSDHDNDGAGSMPCQGLRLATGVRGRRENGAKATFVSALRQRFGSPCDGQEGPDGVNEGISNNTNRSFANSTASPDSRTNMAAGAPPFGDGRSLISEGTHARHTDAHATERTASSNGPRLTALILALCVLCGQVLAVGN